MKTLISIVMPTFNCEKYLSESVDSLLRQTLEEFELIIVDDGSTDRSFEIAQSYATKDTRITSIQQEHQYAGVARNTGIDMANGEYMLFLDSDDVFDPELLQEASDTIIEYDADICVFGARSFDNKTGDSNNKPNMCRADLCPSNAVFNKNDCQAILGFTTPAPWNKLFKSSFIKRNKLRFQDTRSANDFLFVSLALLMAEKIIVLDKPLVNYRINTGTSLQNTQAKDPLAFYKAAMAFQQEASLQGLVDGLEPQYRNYVLDCCIHNLKSVAKNPEAFKKVYTTLRSDGFRNLMLTDISEDEIKIFPKSNWRWYKNIMRYPYWMFVTRENILATFRHNKPPTYARHHP